VSANVLPGTTQAVKVSRQMSAADYCGKVEALRTHIIEGDVYEVNFCQAFFADEVVIDPVDVFERLYAFSPNPFSCYAVHEGQHVICGSPERFLKKTGRQLLSQPIKGTIARGRNPEADEEQKQQLLHSEKDRAENVMIVDLVRNDLSRSCRAGTVKVNELCGLYTFTHLHHLVSTVSGTLRDDVHWIDALRAAFPMGSMTGAPKVKAMELIDRYETCSRGVYSGSLGYITPQGDFDFNVVIRSLLYNQHNRYLSLQTGGAIVFESIPEKEYSESLLKAESMLRTLGAGTVSG
jgi:para-aminobenzoate synthetase component 1